MENDKEKESKDLQHCGDEPHLLREIVRTHQVMMYSLSRRLGTPASQWVLLRILATSEEAVGVMDLARILGINAAAITRQVQGMESEGLVQRRPDGRDKRRHYVCLTEKGMQMFLEVHARSHSLECALSQVVTTAEMISAAKILARVRVFIEEYREEKVHESDV